MKEQQSLFERYPQVPGYQNRDTSKEAAERAKPTAETLRTKVYNILKVKPMSADECAAELGETVLSIRPRVTELSKLGKIKDSGKRTLNVSKRRAVVWEVK